MAGQLLLLQQSGASVQWQVSNKSITDVILPVAVIAALAAATAAVTAGQQQQFIRSSLPSPSHPFPFLPCRIPPATPAVAARRQRTSPSE